METLGGYPLDDTVSASGRTLVVRSIDPADGSPVVLKVLRGIRPPRERVLWFRREFELLRRLSGVQGVARGREIGEEDGRWFMVLEDIGGLSLASWLETSPLRIGDFLSIAVRIAAILADVHRRDVIHRDINPSNIIVNRGTGQVRLIDFGISTRLSREVSRFGSAAGLQGTLHYIAPEQTGRMNRSVDLRADLYSLGATFYQLLTQRTPFALSDPVALVHAHIAREPVPIAEVVDGVPPAVASIVAKLMSKAPEDRYQSADGLRIDLEHCMREERESGTVAPFALDQHHVPVTLTMPETLYGRQRELARLMDAFDDVAGGGTGWVSVSGFSGVGKSSLVHELHRPITERSGFFLAGKFDQLRRDVPYAVVVQALRDLSRQLLTEPQERLDAWRSELVAALGPNGQVLLDVIPELAHVIGPQQPAVELSSSEGRNRLQRVFSRFIGVFARAAHPLTIFLDDLQWVDRGSLELLESVLIGGEVSHLLVIGAYRDNEVEPGHPLLLSLDRLRHADVHVREIVLAPLDAEHLTEFVSDLTGRSPGDARPLATLIREKTDGNPFFAREFVRTMEREGLLRVEDRRWVWDLEAIAALGISDSVVELVAARLLGLPAETRDLLQLAGALGAQFDLGTLAAVAGRRKQEAWGVLWPAVDQGLLVALSDAHKLLDLDVADGEEQIVVPLRFVHDRVQQAAFELRGEAERERQHWDIGQRIAALWPGDQTDERLFEIVGHLNAGRAFAASTAERDSLAGLNLRAAVRARASAAFASAHQHARLGIELLGEHGDARRYELALPLLEACVETAYQTADYEAMDRWFDRTLAASRGVLDVAWVQEIRTEALNAQGRPLDALANALDYLAALGIELPRDPGMDEVVAEMGVAGSLLAATSIDQLQGAPEITDPATRVAVGLICKIYSSAYVASPFVFALVCLRQFVLVARHGNCAQSPLTYAVYGLLMAGLADDVASGYAFGSLCNRMLGRPDTRRFEAQALHLFNCHTRMWREHVSLCADGERRAYQTGLETGEFEFGCYGGHVATKYSLLHGEDLGMLLDEARQYTVRASCGPVPTG